jgi:deoxyribodipyrimidine photo-lyase
MSKPFPVRTFNPFARSFNAYHPPVINPSRIKPLNDAPVADGKYVLYWMQQSQRAQWNHALEHAVEYANQLRLPLIVGFGLMDNYPQATERHYAFMLEGLAQTSLELALRGIPFVIRRGVPRDVAISLAQDAAIVVTDRGYLRHLRAWRRDVASQSPCRVVQVESDAVVPVELASNKPEVGARTLRPKIHRLWTDLLQPVEQTTLRVDSLGLNVATDFDPADVDATLKRVSCDRAVKRSTHFAGGTHEALARLERFVESTLPGYAEGRNEPADARTSQLSPYLQYGQISPVEVALRVRDAARGDAADRDSFIEELIVRRELAINWCEHRDDYDSFDALPGWAKASLRDHERDPRDHVYAREQLEQARTHDPYWNAAQKQMTLTGYMHNYMRMYWGKKILEWSPTPREAFETTIWLNNRYLLDGLNATSYASVAWCFGLHDRPWTARKVFGVIRYMNDKGLERKFDIDRYVEQVAQLEGKSARRLF